MGIVINASSFSVVFFFPPSSGMSNLEKAKTAIRIIIQQKLLFTKRDELGLVLMGTKESQNMLYDETEVCLLHG